jgi:hypothetical protein
MQSSSRVFWAIVALLFVGVFGGALAITGAVAALPPVAGGTCGPGTNSEAAIVALFDPGSIGAGPEPATNANGGRQEWKAFVHECQTAADNRGLVVLAVLVGSIVVVAVGSVLVLRSAGKPRCSRSPCCRHGDSNAEGASRGRAQPVESAPVVLAAPDEGSVP